MFSSFRGVALFLLLGALLIPAARAADSVEYFTPDRLEQLAAPIALYPDALAAQVLMASTYPLQVVEAARWRERHPNLRDQALDQAAARESWDPSVKSLLHFPDLLKRMSENLDWTRDLGDAVLSNQSAVMAAIQRLRRYAYDAGNLQTNDKQRVVVEEQVIRVEPATEVIYVPSYSPTLVYGGYWSPGVWYYPFFGYPYGYWYPFGYSAYGIVSFGLGVLTGAAIWGYCDWGYGWIGYHDHHHHWQGGGGYYRGDRGAPGDRPPPARWEHNPINRRGVAYRDSETMQRYDAVRRDLNQRRSPFGPPRSGAGAVEGREALRSYDLMGRRSAPEGIAPANRKGVGEGFRSGTKSYPSGVVKDGKPDRRAAGGAGMPGKRLDSFAGGSPGGSRPTRTGPPPQRTLSGRGDASRAVQGAGIQPPNGVQIHSRPQAGQVSRAPQGFEAPRAMQRAPSVQAPSLPRGGATAPVAPSYRSSGPAGGGFAPSQGLRGMGGSGSGPSPGGGFSGPPGGRGGRR